MNHLIEIVDACCSTDEKGRQFLILEPFGPRCNEARTSLFTNSWSKNNMCKFSALSRQKYDSYGWVFSLGEG
jgi:hypothetical protein